MSNAAQPWMPTKPANQYEDDEIRALESFKLSKQMFPALKEEQRLALTRDAIGMAWKEIRASALNDPIIALLNEAREKGLVKKGVTALFISVETDDDGNEVGRFEVPKARKGRNKRFGNDDYSSLIGKEFKREVTNSRKKQSERNGTYILRIEEPWDAEGATAYWLERYGPEKYTFSCRVIQRPASGASAPDIVFPPDPSRESDADLQNDDDVIEVKSMSDVMKATRLRHPQTPGIYFRLDDDGDEDDGEDEGDDAPEAKADTKAKKASNKVHEALDDDEDEDED